jgi:hypothetical protein
MGIYKATFHYYCLPAHHENRYTLYYRASDVEDVKTRFSIPYPCSECPPDAVPHGELEMDWEIEEISELAFELSGARLEPQIV